MNVGDETVLVSHNIYKFHMNIYSYEIYLKQMKRTAQKGEKNGKKYYSIQEKRTPPSNVLA